MSISNTVYSFFIFLNNIIFVPQNPQVLGSSTLYLAKTQPETTTSFLQKEVTEEEEIAYATIEEKNPNIPVGEKEVKKKGINGILTRKYLVTFWNNTSSEKKLIEESKKPPVSEIVEVGTKIVWKTINTPEGERKYWKSIPHVWATSYDKSCEGCDEWTALGTKLDIGTCAVDPKVIKMWTEIFVPGYGLCRALDVGGTIKGNKIDVGFYDLHAQSPIVGWKGSHFTDIYLLDNEPKD